MVSEAVRDVKTGGEHKRGGFVLVLFGWGRNSEQSLFTGMKYRKAGEWGGRSRLPIIIIIRNTRNNNISINSHYLECGFTIVPHYRWQLLPIYHPQSTNRNYIVLQSTCLWEVHILLKAPQVPLNNMCWDALRVTAGSPWNSSVVKSFREIKGFGTNMAVKESSFTASKWCNFQGWEVLLNRLLRYFCHYSVLLTNLDI